MRKIIKYAMLAIVGTFIFTSCEKDPIGNTTAEPFAGDWYVTVSAIDNTGKLVYSDADLFGLGKFHLDTYNTANNDKDSIWVNDNKSFWDFKVKIKANADSLTFRGTNIQNVSYDCKVTIKDGKIMKNAAKTPSGMPADSIQFTVMFSDDTYPAQYGYYAYRVAGFRYTGFTKDE